MLNNKNFWLTLNAGALILHAAGVYLYVTQGFTNPIVQLWGLIVIIHILEIPLAFLAVRERRILWSLTMINTLLFGFTWWVPARRGLYHK